MATPLFSEPSEPSFEGSQSSAPSPSPSAGKPAPKFIPVTLDVGAEEPLEIVNFAGSLPDPSSAKTRNTFVRAAEASGLLTDNGRYAVARALVQPEQAAAAIKSDLLTSATVETATLDVLTGHVLATELWPVLQPRTEAESLTVARPQIRGELDSDGRPIAELVLIYDSLQHLVEHLHQTIAHTWHTGKDYGPSILAHRVGRPVLAHVARIEFRDETTPGFTVLAVRDGITRRVRALAARMGGKPTADQVAQQMISELVMTLPPRAGKAPDPSQDHARGREKVAEELRARFNAGMAGEAPAEDAVRIGQTYTLPAEIYLGVHATATQLLPAEEIFPEAMKAVVASIHTEFKGWDEAAQSVDIGERALLRAQHGGFLRHDVVRLATGVLGPEATPVVFGDSTIPGTALWRGVYLIHELSQPVAFEGVKDQLKALKGMTVIQRKRFLSYLGPLIDVPWRSSKARSLQQARRAWTGGSPIPHALLGTAWEPMPTTDFLSLVPRALNGDANARRTLQVAGGIALVADRLLSSNIGSAVQSGVVPFRADPHEIINLLGRPDNEAGLYQLAHAAQAFQADKPAVNSFSERDFKDGGGLPADSYVVPAVEPSKPADILKDGTGQPKQLTQWEVVWLSDPDRAERAVAQKKADDAKGAGFQMPEGAAQQADLLREALDSGLKAAEDVLDRLLRLSRAGDGAVGPALGDHEKWVHLRDMGQKISSLITVNEPPEDDEPQSADLDEEMIDLSDEEWSFEDDDEENGDE